MNSKDCDKGKPCGSACIEAKDRCLQALSNASNEALQKYSKKLAQLEKAGDADGIERLNRAADVIANKLAGQIDEKGALKVSDAAKSQNLTYEEAKALANRKNLLDESKAALIIAEGKLDLEKWSDEDAKQVYELLPAKAQKQIREGGQASASGWHNPNAPNGVDVPGATAKPERGHAVTKLWLEMGGRDGYTLGKETFNLAEMDVEHITPLSKGGKDHPDNWTLLRAGLNRNRAAIDLPEFVKTAESYSKLSPEEYKAKVLDKATAERGASNLARTLAESFTGNGDDYDASPAKLKKYIAQGMNYRGLGTTRITRSGQEDAPVVIRDTLAKAALNGKKDLADSVREANTKAWQDLAEQKISTLQLATILTDNLEKAGWSGDRAKQIETFNAGYKKKLKGAVING